MKHCNAHTRSHAFTLTELLVVAVAIGLIAVLLLPALAAAKRKSYRISCINNLEEGFLGLKIWEQDHTNNFPMSVSINFGGTLEYVGTGKMYNIFKDLSNELEEPRILVCPADVRQPAANWPVLATTNISYFLNVGAINDTYPGIVFMGDRNILGGTKSTNGLTVFKPTDSASWGSDMHHGQGNIGLTDGSVAQMTSFGLAAILTNGITRLAIP